MNDFRFENLERVHGLWPILLLVALLIGLEFRRRRLLDRLLSGLMQSRLVERIPPARRYVGLALLGLSLLCLLLALMRPQWGSTSIAAKKVESQIMICLDVSKSMLAEDAVPNRLERAKAEIESLLGLMNEGQQVGLTAFAGKATVMCPLTTDHGFLRLILREAEPGSIGLGGTKIGEAIRKAVSGFRKTGDVNRTILLITDGEDHESFPLDAATAAKEKGIRIVSVGFGDEAGSKIQITDPRTGVVNYVKDSNGTDVISRLDGETLREIALQTDGAYIPAGTGALDLESIYDAHIRSLASDYMDEQTLVIRNEAFQWCLVLALGLLIASILCSHWFTPKPQEQSLGPIGTAVPTTGARNAASVALLLCLAVPAIAQEEAATNQEQAAQGSVEESAATRASEAGPESGTEVELDLDMFSPRELYNRALVFVSSQPDKAEELLNEARDRAKVDGELRFSALYNLGWVEVNRADKQLEEAPEQALQHLEMAASRFREAIRLRPESNDARHNLEIISRRILALADSLAQKNEKDVKQRLDELIDQLRQHQRELQQAVMRYANTRAADQRGQRDEFRKLGVTQRQLISVTQKVLEDITRDVQVLKGKISSELTEDEQLSLARLPLVSDFVNQSLQRLNKARSQSRRLQAQRSFVRWSAGLNALKEARDQLRDPVELLGTISQDATELAMQTRTKQGMAELLANEESAENFALKQPEMPAWLSFEFLADAQTSIADRTQNVRQLLASIAAQAQQTETLQADQSSSGPEQDAEREAFFASVRSALPFVEQAENAFNDTVPLLEAENAREAFSKQGQALEALAKASEYFLDVRRLIDVMWSTELQMQSELGLDSEQADEAEAMPATSSENLSDNSAGDEDAGEGEKEEQLTTEEPAEQTIDEQAGQDKSDAVEDVTDAKNEAATRVNFTSAQIGSAAAAQQMNLERAERLQRLLELELNKIVASESASGAEDAEASEAEQADQVASMKQRNELAQQLLAATNEEMQKVADLLSGLDELNENSNGEVEQLRSSFAAAVDNLEELRRLYFSLVEYLRETTMRQATLNDDTVQKLGTSSEARPEIVGPMKARQETLQQTAAALSQAIKAQGEQASAAQQSPNATPTQARPGGENDEAARFDQASELVEQAGDSMGTAATQLAALPTRADAELKAGINEETALPAQSTEEEEQPDLPSTGLDAVVEPQTEALQRLVEALQLLEQRPPPEEQQEDQQDQQEQNQQEQNQSQDQQQQQQQQSMSTQQMLQAIQEREAERRKDKQEANLLGRGAVEKDW